MGGSYRQDFKNGRMKNWNKKLDMVVQLINDVIIEVQKTIGEDGQFDNAFDDGGFCERLIIARDLVNNTLPEG